MGRTLAPVRALARRLRREASGHAMLEFALTLPLVLAVGGWGIELSNLALVNLRLSQYALNLADSASRVGQDTSGGISNFREFDANDVLQGARLQGAAIGLTTRGRVTLSSLEYVQRPEDKTRIQRIHWQRCIGLMSGTGYDSTYGTVSPSAGSDSSSANAGLAAPAGMGDPGAEVKAPTESGVMFVEINYQYKPLFGSLYVAPRIIHYVASFIVRDNRSFLQVYPSPNDTASTCDKYTT